MIQTYQTHILPFGQTLRLWRTARGLTQETLARRAKLSRPNLSSMERGRMEVSLKTLRALAVGLDIRPGVLVDGVPPETSLQRPSRETLERIAEAVVRGGVQLNDEERQLVEALRRIVAPRTAAAKRRWTPRRGGKRAAQQAWLWVRACYPEAMFTSLIERISERQAA